MQEVISTDKKFQQILILPVFGFVFKSISAEELTRVLIKMAMIVVHKEETCEKLPPSQRKNITDQHIIQVKRLSYNNSTLINSKAPRVNVQHTLLTKG